MLDTTRAIEMSDFIASEGNSDDSEKKRERRHTVMAREERLSIIFEIIELNECVDG